MCYIQVKNIRLNSFYEEKKIKLCLTKQLLNMFKLWCEWGIRWKLRSKTCFDAVGQFRIDREIRSELRLVF